MKYYIQTLGCAMNYSDSERVAAILEKLGYNRTTEPDETDLYIFNTCSIRQKGEDKVFGQLHNLEEIKKRKPRLLVGITGCMVRTTSSRNSSKEVKDEIIKRVDSVDFVFKITEAHKIGEVLAEAEPQLDLPQLEEATMGEAGNAQATDYLRIKPKYTSQFQAFVPIQIGCDKYCTYCIVPYSRGREKSRPMEDILKECRALVEHGCKEITLVGQTVNSYGLSMLDKKSGMFGEHARSESVPLRRHADSVARRQVRPTTKVPLSGTAWSEAEEKDPFVQLLTEIDRLKEMGLNRVRFTSPHPHDYTDALIQAHVDLQTLCPHFHLPVQSGNDQMLKRMNRKYTVEEFKNIVTKIRAKLPDASITTDIIVGFCGETAEQYEDSYKLFEELRFDMVYISRYSPRPGTVSYNAFKDDVSYEDKALRWHRMNDLLEICSREKNQKMEGKIAEVLVEKFNEATGECEGKNREFKVIQFPGNQNLVGAIVQVRVTKGLDWFLKGELLERKSSLIKKASKKLPAAV